MKIATFNVNGIKTRLPHLLRWLERAPRIPSVPRVSLSSHAITPPPRTVPNV